MLEVQHRQAIGNPGQSSGDVDRIRASRLQAMEIRGANSVNVTRTLWLAKELKLLRHAGNESRLVLPMRGAGGSRRIKAHARCFDLCAETNLPA